MHALFQHLSHEIKKTIRAKFDPNSLSQISSRLVSGHVLPFLVYSEDELSRIIEVVFEEESRNRLTVDEQVRFSVTIVELIC